MEYSPGKTHLAVYFCISAHREGRRTGCSAQLRLCAFAPVLSLAFALLLPTALSEKASAQNSRPTADQPAPPVSNQAAPQASDEGALANPDENSRGGRASKVTICGQPIDRAGTDEPWWRPIAGKDYLVLGYDAESHSVEWFDYKHQGAIPTYVDRNGSLVPVVYSREKVLVHICGLHPTDTVSISTNDLAVPEEGADIRGVTPAAAATPLAPTLDALGTASTAGTALGPAGFSYGAPPAISVPTTPLFTPGSSKDGKTYVDATVNISPDALAAELAVVLHNAADAKLTIKELESGPNGSPKASTPGSIDELQNTVDQLLAQLKADDVFDGTGQFKGIKPMEHAQALSEFNDYLARTQTLVTEINGLANGVSLASIPTRAVGLRQNWESVMNVLELVYHTIEDDEQYNTMALSAVSPADGKTAIFTRSTCGDLFEAFRDKKVIDNWMITEKKPLGMKLNPPDTVACHAFELFTMSQFINDFRAAFAKYKVSKILFQDVLLMPQAPFPANRPIYMQVSDTSANALARGVPAVQLMAYRAQFSAVYAQGAGANPDLANAWRTIHTFGDAVAGQPQTQNSQSSSNANPICDPTKYPPKDANETNPDGCEPLEADYALKYVNDLFTMISGDGDPTSKNPEGSLRGKLETLDNSVGQVFFEMNRRYRESWVEQTDALPPLTSNTIVRIGINVQRNYTPFTLSGGVTIGSGSPASAAPSSSAPGATSSPASAAAAKATPAAGAAASAGGSTATSPPSTSGNNDVTVLMEIHRLANFNLVGGAMAIHVPSISITSVPEYANYGTPTTVTSGTGSTATTTYYYSASGTCNGGTTPTVVATTNNTSGVTPPPALYYCYGISQKAPLQPAAMAGIAWFPFGGRDYFSREKGAPWRAKNWVPSLLVASAVTSLGSAFIGPNFEPINGLDVFGGYASAHQSSLPQGVSAQTVYQAGSTGSPPTLNTATHLKGGFSFGVGFDLSVFLQIFGKTQGPALP